MTTDISVKTTVYQADKRSWLWGPHGTGPGDNPGIPIDLSTFSPSAHYPNGFIPSGIVLGKITASGRYGPFDATATDGRQTAVGHLFSSITVPTSTSSTPVGGALFVHGFVDPTKLPIASGAGALPATGRPALIHYAS